jgi:hypothetical protein
MGSRTYTKIFIEVLDEGEREERMKTASRCGLARSSDLHQKTEDAIRDLQFLLFL